MLIFDSGLYNCVTEKHETYVRLILNQVKWKA